MSLVRIRLWESMDPVDWREVIRAWRSLPEAEKHRLRWQRIPVNVAASMAFAGEPVSLEMLEAEHASRPMPPTTARPASDI